MSTKTVKKNEVSTEVPAKKGWRIKQYYIDKKVYEGSKEELAKSPNQVQIMVKHFAEKFNEPSSASQGRIMCQSAIDNAGLKTVIEPHVLFAYYRKTMESFGLRLAN